MTKVNTDLISCIAAALYGHEVDCDISKCVNAAYAHGVMNLLYYAAMKMPPQKRPEEKLLSTLKHKAYADIMRETMQRKVLEEVFRRFEQSQIRCVALKGSVLKDFYPKPELRYMSDIDILIDPAKAEEVHSHFAEMGCKVLHYDTKSDTDQYLTPEGINFEIKKTLVNESFNAQTRDFTENLLSFAKPLKGFEFVSRLPHEEHYAYILCHIIKHLTYGGVGVRPIMDVWTCMQCVQMDEPKLSNLLAKLDLTQFAATAEHLASVWFGDAEATDLDAELGDYILGSGAFGTDEQRVTDRLLAQKSGENKILYFFKRLFPPYRSMRKHYPILIKIPILLPFYWIWRIVCAGIFGRKKLMSELDTVSQIDSDKLRSRAEFYKRCGINL